MSIKKLTDDMNLNDAQLALLEQVEDIAKKEGVEVNSLVELKDLLVYLEEKADKYSELNAMQLGIVENKVEEALAGGNTSKKKSTKKESTKKESSAYDKTAKAVAQTAAGTVGRQVGKEIGESLGGSFGKTLGGNVGAELARSIVSNFKK